MSNNNNIIGPYEIVIGLCAKIKTKDNVPLTTHFDLSLEQNLFKIFNKDSYTIPLNIRIRKRDGNKPPAATNKTQLQSESTQLSDKETDKIFKSLCGCKTMKEDNLSWSDIVVSDHNQDNYLVNNKLAYNSIAGDNSPPNDTQQEESVFETSETPVKRTRKHYVIDPLVTPNVSMYKERNTHLLNNKSSVNTNITTSLLPYETNSNYKPSVSNYINPHIPQSYIEDTASRNTFLNLSALQQQEIVTKTTSYMDENNNNKPDQTKHHCSPVGPCKMKQNDKSVSQHKYPTKRFQNAVKQAMQIYDKKMQPMQQVLNDANRKLKNISNRGCKCRPLSTIDNFKDKNRSPHQTENNVNVALIKPGTTFKWANGNINCPYLRKIVADEGLTGPFDVVYIENHDPNAPPSVNPTINILSRTVNHNNSQDQPVVETNDFVETNDVVETNDIPETDVINETIPKSIINEDAFIE